MKKEQAFGSGDLNLAASMLTMGIPPSATEPIRLIARDDGGDYTRFHFSELSYCGKYDPTTLSAAWSAPERFKAENQGHPFGKLMDFIREKPRGCRREGDWLEHAAKYLGLPVDSVRETYRRISQVCKASPDSEVSFVCAFIRNREDLIEASRQLSAAGNFHTMMDRGKSIASIRAKAPARIRDYLLSQIR